VLCGMYMYLSNSCGDIWTRSGEQITARVEPYLQIFRSAPTSRATERGAE